MDKKEFEKKLKEKKAKEGKEVETIEMITSGEIVKEAQEPKRVQIITTADVMGYRKRSTDRPKTIITTADLPVDAIDHIHGQPKKPEAITPKEVREEKNAKN